MQDLQLFINSPVATTLFVITLITSIKAFRDPNLMYKFIFIPYEVVHNKEYYRMFTAGLIHANTLHLAMNMLAFYFFAFYLELVIGHWEFALLYIGALLISKFPSLARHKDSSIFRSLGASGAISGVVLSMIMLYPDMKLQLLFLPFFDFPAWVLGVLYIGYSFYASFRGQGRINHDAHLWGALAGIVLTLILKPSVVHTIQDWISTW